MENSEGGRKKVGEIVHPLPVLLGFFSFISHHVSCVVKPIIGNQKQPSLLIEFILVKSLTCTFSVI